MKHHMANLCLGEGEGSVPVIGGKRRQELCGWCRTAGSELEFKWWRGLFTRPVTRKLVDHVALAAGIGDGWGADSCVVTSAQQGFWRRQQVFGK